MTIRANIYYQRQEDGTVKVWMHVGQLGSNYTVVSGPTTYTEKDFNRLHAEVNEPRWEELDKPTVRLRD